MNRRIVIRVSADGQSQVLTEGFRGRQCQAASRFLERALGRKQSEQLTRDYFKTETNSVEQQSLNQGDSE